MESSNKKYFVIYDETNNTYWNRINFMFDSISSATEYEAISIDQIYSMIEDNDKIGCGFYSVKQIIKKL